MTRPSRSLLVAACALTGTAAVALPTTARAVTTPIRYASVTGGGLACSPALPCGLLDAVNDAPAGSEVVIEPGSYTVLQQLTDEGHSGMYIHGKNGAARPVIHTATGGFGLDASSLSNVEVDTTGGGSGITVAGGTVSHVVVRASADDAAACVIFFSITDSLCVASGLGGNALAIRSSSAIPGTIDVAIRGVTAIGTQSDAAGLAVDAGEATSINVTATDDIIHGGFVDVGAQADGTTDTAVVTLRHSDYTTTRANSTGATITGNATDTAKAPVFVDAPHGNYHEAATSPTINKGSAAPANDTDAAGRPRTIGSAPDMGAYEYLQAPAVAHLTKHHVTHHAATFRTRVNAEGLTTRVRFVARQGHHTLRSAWTSAHNSRAQRTVTLRIGGLRSATKCVVRLVASNAGGITTSKALTFRTP
jgi:hypothetical protein